MKISMIALIVCVVSSVPVYASSIQQGQEAVSHAERMLSAADSRVQAAADAYGTGSVEGWANASESAGRERTDAQAQLKGSIEQLANAISTPPVNPSSISGTSYRLGINQLQQKSVSNINVAVSSLPANTLVSSTINGITHRTTAGVIAALDPQIQVAVPHIPAFQRNHTGNSGGLSHGGSVHGSTDNNGNQNEHDHAVGRANGVGGHSEFR